MGEQGYKLLLLQGEIFEIQLAISNKQQKEVMADFVRISMQNTHICLLQIKNRLVNSNQ